MSVIMGKQKIQMTYQNIYSSIYIFMDAKLQSYVGNPKKILRDRWLAG